MEKVKKVRSIRTLSFPIVIGYGMSLISILSYPPASFQLILYPFSLNTHRTMFIGGRKLKTKQRNMKKQEQRKLASQAISCDQCIAYECYAAENDADDQNQSREELDESVSEWIADLAECKETGVQWNDMDLYVGAMCSPYGDGVELAVFVDEDCTLYTNQQSFYDVWDPSNDNEDGVNYLTYAEEIIQSAFSQLTPCAQQVYGSPDGYAGDDADEDDEDENEMNDYCQDVLAEEIVDFNNCAAEENDDQGKRREGVCVFHDMVMYSTSCSHHYLSSFSECCR